MDAPHLDKAPIVEGLIDIQVKHRSGFVLDDLQPLKDELKNEYPEVKDLQTIEAGFQIKDGLSAGQSIATTKIGFRLERKTPSAVVIARRNGFTFSRLKPYDNWEDLTSQAKPIWERYCAISQPESIIRVATRFINRIELPIDGLDFDDYMTAAPRLPKGFPESISGFLTRLILSDEKTGAEIGIVQALESPNMEKRVLPVLLDIDVYKETSIPPSEATDLWQLLDSFRDIKNRAFFGSITDKTVRLFT